MKDKSVLLNNKNKPQFILLNGPVNVYLISKSYLSKAQTTGMILSSKLGTIKN